MHIFLGLIFCFSLVLPTLAQNKVNKKISAPDFTVNSIDGKTFDSTRLKRKIVVLNLWFINCPNCMAETKLLNQVVDEYQNKDVVFIGMATNKRADLEKFLKQNPFKYIIVPQAMQTTLSFGEPDKNGEINIPFPMHVVIDRDGKIVVKKSGVKGLNDMKNELKHQFESAPAKSK